MKFEKKSQMIKRDQSDPENEINERYDHCVLNSVGH